jgi:hypothetical protein
MCLLFLKGKQPQGFDKTCFFYSILTQRVRVSSKYWDPPSDLEIESQDCVYSEYHTCDIKFEKKSLKTAESNEKRSTHTLELRSNIKEDIPKLPSTIGSFYFTLQSPTSYASLLGRLHGNFNRSWSWDGGQGHLHWAGPEVSV